MLQLMAKGARAPRTSSCLTTLAAFPIPYLGLRLTLIYNVKNATLNLQENVLKISHLVATTYVYLSSEAETFSSFPIDPLSCNVQPPGFSLMT